MTSNKKNIFLSPPHLNGEEIDYIKDAFDSNWIAPIGPHVDQFEKEMASYIGVNYSAALSSGTAALHLALKIIGAGKDDIVFCSDLTFVATVNAVKYLNAIPIFIDSDKSSWNMCPESLEIAFNKHSPKAVVVTDIYGQSANYELIIEICKKYNTPVIEDAAESLGAEYNGKKCGTFGEMSILSFNGNKIITTGGGGMLLSNNKDYINSARKLSTQAREPGLHYEHKEVGYNYRMSNILAGIGRAQLKSLDDYVNRRRTIFNYYLNKLSGIKNVKFMPEIINGKSTNWLSVIIIEKISHNKIDEIIMNFAKQKIEVRPVWKPMHLQPLFKNELFYYKEAEPVSNHLFKHGLCLPSGSALKENDLDRIVSLLLKNIN